MEAHMHQRWFGVTIAVAFVGSITIAGQSQSSGVQRSPRDQGSTQREITAVGCLQRVDAASTESAKRADANAGGVAPSAAAAGTLTPVGPTWVLEGATIAAGSGSAARSGNRPSTTGTTGSSGSGANYVLEGRLDALPAQLGHRVEVKGMLTGSTPSTGNASDAPGSASDTPGSTASAGAGPRALVASAGHLRVTAVRMISQSCTGQ
jgi:hypothetical protein